MTVLARHMSLKQKCIVQWYNYIMCTYIYISYTTYTMQIYIYNISWVKKNIYRMSKQIATNSRFHSIRKMLSLPTSSKWPFDPFLGSHRKPSNNKAEINLSSGVHNSNNTVGVEFFGDPNKNWKKIGEPSIIVLVPLGWYPSCSTPQGAP